RLEHHGPAAEGTMRAPAALVHAHFAVSHAIALAITPILRPVFKAAAGVGLQSMRQDRLPAIDREQHGEAIEAWAFAAILRVALHDAIGHLRHGKVGAPNREVGHVSRRQWRFLYV